nr:MAG TPA: hypothetical protein [Caudoviricetes sp.]
MPILPPLNCMRDRICPLYPFREQTGDKIRKN